MTAIQQNPVSSHHSIDDAGHPSGNRNEGGAGNGRQATNNSTGIPGPSTVNISYHAVLRLRAFQEQKETPLSLSLDGQYGLSEQSGVQGSVSINSETHSDISKRKANDSFPQYIENMLLEVQENIVHRNEPGYQHLVNLLNNYGDTIEDQQQLQEVMRKEQFMLSRRKPFMGNSDFQSYSQVLNQFTNIIDRQQYSL